MMSGKCEERGDAVKGEGSGWVKEGRGGVGRGG